jgi:uncharacterized protein (DUF697 family)
MAAKSKPPPPPSETASREEADVKQGERLLSAVERILSNDADLIARAERHLVEIPLREAESEDAWRARVGAALVSDFSTRSAISGGAAALPSLVPGVGSLISLVGGSLADMALMLKFEVEMTLSLLHLHGYDITNKRERQLAFLLASVGTYDARSGQNYLLDLARAQGTAIWNYTPRQLSKAVLSVMAKVAVLSLSRSLVRVLPVVGVVVGASANKVLTRQVGRRCMDELVRRRQLEAAEAEAEAAPPKAKPRARKSRGR